MWGSLADDECLASGQIRFKAIILRGAIFTELYRRRISGTSPFAAPTGVPAPYNSLAPAVEDEDGKLQMALLAFADCVVQHDRADASAMVVAPTASQVQNTSLVALRSALGPCLPQGQQITLSRPVLEGSIAEILYREPGQVSLSESK